MTKAHIGTMGWSYNFWRGSFYGDTTKSEDFLREYSKHFDTVEVDNTFYRVPSTQMITKWRLQTPKGFLFSAKFPRTITHVKMLKNCESEVNWFIQSISEWKEKLGVLLLQFPPTFSDEHLPLLQDFLASLPKRFSYAVEVRNGELLGSDLPRILRDQNVALTIIEHPFIPRSEELTANFAYLRWEGDRRKVAGTLGRVEVDMTENIKAWAGRIMDLLRQNVEVFGYFSKFYSGHPPADAKKLVDVLAQLDTQQK